jgi:hypothetical protein
MLTLLCKLNPVELFWITLYAGTAPTTCRTEEGMEKVDPTRLLMELDPTGLLDEPDSPQDSDSALQEISHYN